MLTNEENIMDTRAYNDMQEPRKKLARTNSENSITPHKSKMQDFHEME